MASPFSGQTNPGIPAFLAWGEHQTLIEVAEVITAQIQHFLRLDRVLLYRFDASFNGEVLAEACDESRLPTLLGLHFPASDIPPQARSLFQKARQRMIVDVMSKHKILLADDSGPQSRISLHEDARYSPVDPCHLQYLLGLGVMSSITFSIIHQGKLWGLLVGHHSDPRHFSETEIQSVQLLVDQLAVALAQEQLRQQVHQHQRREQLLIQLTTLISQDIMTPENWQKILQIFEQGLDADGCRLYLLPGTLTEQAIVHRVGLQPADEIEASHIWPEVCQALEPIEGALPQADLAAGHCQVLSRKVNEWRQHAQGAILAPLFEPVGISSVLVMPICDKGQTLGYISLYRQEETLEIMWAGQQSPDPRNHLPRESFAAWREHCRRARPWQPHELELAQSARLYLYMSLMQNWVDHRMQQRSAHDAMTQLPNWLLFNKQLNLAVMTCLQQGNALAVGILDLNKFKQINRTHGHTFGNYLLQSVAHRLAECLAAHLPPTPPMQNHMLARWHGDKFALLLPVLHGREDIHRMAQALLHSLREPFFLQGQEIFLTASLGIAIAPYDGNTADALVQRAETAMYQCKQHQRDGHQIYSPAMTVGDGFFHQRLANDLYRALTQQELVLYYQPQADLQTGHITGVEVLVRWQHPQLGLVPPNQFIPIAEETGLIGRLGEWVLRTACLQYRQWRQSGLPALRLAVNLSASQFESSQIVGLVREVLEDSGISPSDLELEITEETVTKDLPRAVKVLSELKAMGVKIALDDFGTGYSSLNVLKHFPVDTLKIDKSFVRDCPKNSRDVAIAQTIIALGHGLNLNVLAEGIETPEHLECLQRLGCDSFQGYYLARPQPADVTFALLMAQDCSSQAALIEAACAAARQTQQDDIHNETAATAIAPVTAHLPKLLLDPAVKATPRLPAAPPSPMPAAVGISSMTVALQPHRQQQYQLQREQLIRTVTEKIRQSLHLEDILSTTVEEVRHLIEADRVVLYQFSNNWEGDIVQESVAPEYPSLLGLRVQDNCFASHYVKLYRQGRIRAIGDVATADIADCHRQFLQKLKIQANLVVPVIYQNQLWGLLIVHQCRGPRDWQSSEVELLGQLAVQIAIAIHQGELYQQLELANRELHILSAQDSLTRIANRHRFDQHLIEEWHRLQRSQMPLSLILGDIDYFKQYNDTYGHLAGDRCLRQVADILRTTVQRPGDLVARYGGEEFVLLLPETTLPGAQQVAQRIQTELGRLAIPHGGSPLKHLTLSLGVACLVPQAKTPPSQLIAQADAALYRAKDSGRNQLILAQP